MTQPTAQTPAEERYRLLVRLGRLINSSLNLQQVFRAAAAEVRRLLGCDRVHLILLQPQEGTWRGFAVEFSPEPRDVEIPVQTLNQSAAAWVQRHRRMRDQAQSGRRAWTSIGRGPAARRRRVSGLRLLSAHRPRSGYWHLGPRHPPRGGPRGAGTWPCWRS